MHRALIVGAGRIGAAFQWPDDEYCHAGAYKALKDRVQLLGFVEPDEERAIAAQEKWGVPAWDRLESALQNLKPDIVSVCTQPEDQLRVLPILDAHSFVKGVWCEKPYIGLKMKKPVQVNYLRRGDSKHRCLADDYQGGQLIVYGKDDLTTRCHFEDLAKFWDATLDYRPFQGPCAYVYVNPDGETVDWFDAGGVDPGRCMRAMLGNLLNVLDGIEGKLWSAAS